MGNKKLTNVQDREELMKLFQNFYHLTGRLPLSNSFLVVPDGESPPGENKVNMKNLYELFINTKHHELVSLPFFGLIRYYFDESSDHFLIKNALTELHGNLFHITLSGARNFRLEALSDLTAEISLLVKHATLQNKTREEIEQLNIAESSNNDRLFTPKTDDPLDSVIEILDDPNVEHKKTVFPYVQPQRQTADEIRTIQQLIEVNDTATEQKKNKKK